MKRLYFTVLLIMLNGPILQAETSTKYIDFEVHHTIFNSMFLNPAIASKYGLRRGENLGVINISVLGKEGHVSRPISGSYKNLLGQQFGLSFRKLVDENAVYFIALFDFDDADVLNFTINVSLPQGNEQIYLRKQMYRHRS